jgi:hypothetical protein
VWYGTWDVGTATDMEFVVFSASFASVVSGCI